jgi:hypothetical protein
MCGRLLQPRKTQRTGARIMHAVYFRRWPGRWNEPKQLSDDPLRRLFLVAPTLQGAR